MSRVNVPTVLATLVTGAVFVVLQRSGVLARLGRGTTVRSVRPGAR